VIRVKCSIIETTLHAKYLKGVAMANLKNSTFAEKLEFLFEEKRKLDGTQYSPTEVLDATVGVLTRVHLWKLRTGKTSNPSIKIVQALADFFGVPPSYFLEENEIKTESTQDNQQEEFQVLLRSFGLDKDERKAVLLMVEAIKKSKK
jgi:transcriptional regulator with XRE-family HTH domain